MWALRDELGENDTTEYAIKQVGDRYYPVIKDKEAGGHYEIKNPMTGGILSYNNPKPPRNTSNAPAPKTRRWDGSCKTRPYVGGAAETGVARGAIGGIGAARRHPVAVAVGLVAQVGAPADDPGSPRGGPLGFSLVFRRGRWPRTSPGTTPTRYPRCCRARAVRGECVHGRRARVAVLRVFLVGNSPCQMLQRCSPAGERVAPGGAFLFQTAPRRELPLGLLGGLFPAQSQYARASL